ncbi:MAG: hypothetical protein WAW80_00240 [Candidatus Saccharimonadales bacterium]
MNEQQYKNLLNALVLVATTVVTGVLAVVMIYIGDRLGTKTGFFIFVAGSLLLVGMIGAFLALLQIPLRGLARKKAD